MSLKLAPIKMAIRTNILSAVKLAVIIRPNKIPDNKIPIQSYQISIAYDNKMPRFYFKRLDWPKANRLLK